MNIFELICSKGVILLIPLLTVLVFIQVIARYIFSYSIVWIEELVRYVLIWISFLGSAYAVRNSEHIAITFIVDKIPKIFAAYVRFFAFFLLTAFFVMCTVQSIIYLKTQVGVMSPSMGIPRALPMIIMPVTFALMTIFQIELIVKYIKDRSNNFIYK